MLKIDPPRFRNPNSNLSNARQRKEPISSDQQSKLTESVQETIRTLGLKTLTV